MNRILFATFLYLSITGAAAAQGNSFGLRIIVVRTVAEANTLLRQLQAGANFGELARTRSLDSSARQDGYIGVFAKQELRPEFQSALEGLKPGETSGVVKIGAEYGLLQMLTAEDTQKMAPDRSAIPNVNATFEDGSTVLMGVAQGGDIERVRNLIAAGAAVNARTRDGITALVVAVQAGHANIARVLLAAGADANVRKADGGTPLMDAAFAGNLEIVRTLLDSKADPNIALPDGSTALMASSVKGHNDIVRALLAAGAQVNAGVTGGGTALMEAAYGGHADTARILLAAGADPKLSNPKGLTALMGAALGGHTDVVEVLLEAGAPASPRDYRNWTALTYARASANSATVRAVLAKATDIAPEERSIAVGGTYLNEYYSSGDPKLLELGAAEFQRVLNSQPQNLEALEWMGAIEFLGWSKPPTLDQFRKAVAFLKRSAELDPKDPDRHYWLAATSSIFLSGTKIASALETANILDDGILHARKAIELDPQFADAMDHLSALYRRKADLIGSERAQLLKLADTAHEDAVKVRQRLGTKPSRFSDQFSRPAVPPAP
jgi:ankyrin repeat protein